MTRRVSFWSLVCCLILSGVSSETRCEQATGEYDVVIYGGTCAAVTAAVQTQRMGKSVVVISPDKHLGGLSSGGLGWTDTGNKAVIGGLAREFYHRIWKHYQEADSWPWQKPEEYGNRGQGTAAIDGQQRTMWIFEPHAAEQVFDDLVREASIPVLRDEWLETGRRRRIAGRTDCQHHDTQRQDDLWQGLPRRDL